MLDGPLPLLARLARGREGVAEPTCDGAGDAARRQLALGRPRPRVTIVNCQGHLISTTPAMIDGPLLPLTPLALRIGPVVRLLRHGLLGSASVVGLGVQ